MEKSIEAIFGVSIWAIIAAYRSAGRTVQEMYDSFIELPLKGWNRLNLLPKNNIIKNDILKKKFKKDLPATFEELKKKIYIGCSEMNTAKYLLFDKGNLLNPLLGSMAIPGIFPSISYENYLLNDGGVIDNFPTTLAKQKYPNYKIIGIALNKFDKNQSPKNILETLYRSFEVMMRKDVVQRSKEVDISFYEKVPCGVLELDKKKREKAFQLGYKNWMEKLDEYKKENA